MPTIGYGKINILKVLLLGSAMLAPLGIWKLLELIF